MTKKRLFEDDADWTFETIITGTDVKDAKNKYYYKRKQAHRVILKSILAKKSSGYKLIDKDLRNCISWLELIVKIQEDINPESDSYTSVINKDREKAQIIKSLFVSSVTMYGKCFSACEGRRVKLERSNLESEFHAIHDEVIKYRNNYTAHSGNKELEICRMIVLLQPNKNKPMLPKFCNELIQPDSWWNVGISEMINLVEHCREYTENKIKELTDRVYDDVLAKGPEYWYAKVK